MRTVAILPVKRFGEAKQRLDRALTPSLRAELARAMAGDVLVALGRCSELAGTIVVTAEPAVGRAAAYQGAMVIDDEREGGQSAACLAGQARAMEDGYERALLVPGDCPALDPLEVDELLRSTPADCAVVIVPDRAGSGTNGLLLTPPDAIAPSFGPGSFERHLQAARAAGGGHRVARPPSLLHDVDTAEDLRALVALLGASDERARRTRTVTGRALAGSQTPA